MTVDVSLILNFVIGGLVGQILWSMRQDKLKLNKLSDKVTKLEAVAVKEDKVRKIVHEETQDMKADIKEIKTIVTDIRVAIGK